MPSSHAKVTTTRGSRYLKQLCRHFDHKAESTFDDAEGHTVFEFGEARMRAGDDTLELFARAEDEERLARVEHVVADHLERFASRDGLAVSWQRDTGTDGG